MLNTISHSNTISQAVISYPKTVVSKYGYYKIPGMGKNEKKSEIAKKHRNALLYWKKERGLTVDGWCKQAGIAEGTLRNFLNSESDTLLASTLELLAAALHISVGQLLREAPILYSLEDDLMLRSSQAIQLAIMESKKNISLDQAMVFTVQLYNHVLKYRKSGNNIEPNEAIASLIIKQSA